MPSSKAKSMAHSFIRSLQSSGYEYRHLLRDYLQARKGGAKHVVRIKQALFKHILNAGRTDAGMVQKVVDLTFWHFEHARHKTI